MHGMDQGVAGLIAGVAGLVGAVFGGLSTAYGARVGARRAIEAIHVQADRQAISEHQQWAREQRRQAAVAVTDAFGTYANTVTRLGQAISAGRDIAADSATSASEAHRSLVITKGHLELWGPDALELSAHRLTRATSKLLSVIANWHASYEELSTTQKTEFQRQCVAALEEMAHARGHYVDSVRVALSVGPASTLS